MFCFFVSRSNRQQSRQQRQYALVGVTQRLCVCVCAIFFKVVISTCIFPIYLLQGPANHSLLFKKECDAVINKAIAAVVLCCCS